MKRGQVLIAALLVFALVSLYAALWLKEAFFALSETRQLLAGLQAKLLCQSGFVLAQRTVQRGELPSSLLALSPSPKATLLLSFRTDETGTKVFVRSEGVVLGRRFFDGEVFAFPASLGRHAFCLFFADPQTGAPFAPAFLPLGRGFVKASLVVVTDDEPVAFRPPPSFVGAAKESLLGVSGTGEMVFGETPKGAGVFTLDGWWQVPSLPGPFQIAFPFAPLHFPKVADETGSFRRVSTLPRFPRQFFLDEGRGLFAFSEHEAGKRLSLSGWTKGFRVYGPLYANASLLLSGTSLFVLRRGEQIAVTGVVLDEGKTRVLLPPDGMEPLGESRGELREGGWLVEGAMPKVRPMPSWAAWRQSVDPTFGGDGFVLPPHALLDLSSVTEEKATFFFEGDGMVTGRAREGLKEIVVLCPATLTVKGSVERGRGTTIWLVAKEIVWAIEPEKPLQRLVASLWATEKSFRVQAPSGGKSGEPARLVLIGSLTVNEVPQVEDEEGRWGLEIFYAPTPFPSFAVQPLGR